MERIGVDSPERRPKRVNSYEKSQQFCAEINMERAKRVRVEDGIELASHNNSINQTVIPQQTISESDPTDPHLNLTDGPLLPPMLPSDQGKHTLVLDMDGTLLREYRKTRSDTTVDFVLRQKSTGARTFVSKRPNLERFMFTMEELFEIVIFTDTSKQRADVILDALISSKCIRHRLYRDSCTEMDGRLVKDLSRLGRDLSKVILIDDCPFCYALQPSNVFPVAWFSGNELDWELIRAYNFITALNLNPNVDVRIALQQSEYSKRNPNPNPSETAPNLLPPMNSCDAGKHTLVLDMDGTLLIELRDKLPECTPDFISPGSDSGTRPAKYVYKRPGVAEFVAAMENLFEMVIFTSSPERRANWLLGHFHIQTSIRFHLFRDSCTSLPGRRVKDLSRLGRDLKKVVIIDDQPHVYELQQFNGIPIKPFDGDPTDRELPHLIPFLKELTHHHDVRPLIQTQYDRELVVEQVQDQS